MKLKISNGGNQPPKNNTTFIELIINIFAYSPNENKANPIPEYSVLYPETNSASASGKSNGALFVSAKQEIKNIIKRGNRGTQNQICVCALTTSDKFNDPVQSKTVIKIKPIETS